MATKLDKPLIRDTGLTKDGKEVLVMMLPSANGGTLVFKEKGKHGAGTEIPLSKIFENQDSISDVVSESKEQKDEKPESKKKLIQGLDTFDTVRMSKLETRLMVLGPEIMTDDLKCKIWKVIRDIREEEREELGMRSIGDTRKGQET
jgi:hypothetical protein